VGHGNMGCSVRVIGEFGLMICFDSGWLVAWVGALLVELGEFFEGDGHSDAAFVHEHEWNAGRISRVSRSR
jgi:hypothetical protein